MSSKRMIGSYEVLSTFMIGTREVFLAGNPKDTDEEKYLCGVVVWDGETEKYVHCIAGDNYLEILKEFGKKIQLEAILLKNTISNMGIPITVIKENDCIIDDYTTNIANKVVAIKSQVLYPESQRADRQLYYITGGYGAAAYSKGGGVFGINIHTGERKRIERRDILGVVKPESLPDWAKEKREQIIMSVESEIRR